MPEVPRVSLIAAVAENGVMGKDGKLPWHFSEDLKRFRRLTEGHAVVMGRKTYESIVEALGGPLLDRTNVVVTRQKDYELPEGCILAHSFEDALRKAKAVEWQEIFVIGGAEVFREAMPWASRLYLTLIRKEYEGDVLFPDRSAFNKIIRKEEKEERGVPFTFLDLERR